MNFCNCVAYPGILLTSVAPLSTNCGITNRINPVITPNTLTKVNINAIGLLALSKLTFLLFLNNLVKTFSS